MSDGQTKIPPPNKEKTDRWDRDVPLEESLYHYYIWKERQAMIQEESQRRYKSTYTDSNDDAKDNENDNTDKLFDTSIDIDDTTDTVTLSKDLFSFDSMKYRQIWNLIRFLFPSIAAKGNVHDASEIVPEVYRRYKEFPKLEQKELTNRLVKHEDDDIGRSHKNDRKRDHSGSPNFSWRKKSRTEEIDYSRRHSGSKYDYRSSSKKDSRSRRRSYVQFDSSDDDSSDSSVAPNRDFEKKVSKLRKFYKKNGHFKVSKSRDPELYEWLKRLPKLLDRQKDRYRQQQWKDRLIDIGYLSDNDSQSSVSGSAASDDEEDSFDERNSASLQEFNLRYEQLSEFYRKNGHFNVPRRSGDRAFGQWFGTLRNQLYTGHPKEIKYKVRKLKKIGYLTTDNNPASSYPRSYDLLAVKRFNNSNKYGGDDDGDIEFQTNDTQNSRKDLRMMKFDQKIDQLYEFYKEYGYFAVPKQYINHSLFKWAEALPRRIFNNSAPLTRHKLRRLHEIGYLNEHSFINKIPVDDSDENDGMKELAYLKSQGSDLFHITQFDLRCDELQKHYKEHDTFSVPITHPNKYLAIWVNNLPSLINNNPDKYITQHKMKRLREIGFLK